MRPIVVDEASADQIARQICSHGAASLLAALGVSPRATMETLGHADVSTTLGVYTHTTPELQREAADRMGEAL